jgi:hypothetical protein
MIEQGTTGAIVNTGSKQVRPVHEGVARARLLD